MKRVEIDKGRNLVVLTFNNNFYPKELIEQSALDFKDVCDCNFQDEKLILKPKSSEVDLNNLGYEFYNYLLGLAKS